MQFETQRRQLTMGNLGETIHNYNLAIAYTMMLFSAVFFSLVGIYLTQILVTSGMRKHPCFCLGAQRKQVKLDESLATLHDQEEEQTGNFEKVSDQKHEY